LTINVFYRWKMVMDIESLRTFLAIARTRHFGKAAEELCVTQSAVSARIRQLEKTLGLALFTRQRNNIQLTPGGMQLIKHAETIVQVWIRARQETGLRAEISRGLAVGAMWDLWETLLRDWVTILCRYMPDTALQIEASTADVLIRKLVEGVIDLAVLFEPPQLLELELRELGYINLVLASTQRGQTLANVFESGYIMVDWGTAFSHAHARYFPDMPAAVLHVNLGALALRHLQHSHGAAYLPEQLLATATGLRRLYRVSDAPCIERSVFAVYRSGSDREGGIRQALALLHDSAETKNPSSPE
jgi:DNA-binding transcriptional LysR family regulator